MTVNLPGCTPRPTAPQAIRAAIRAETGLTASAGVAPNKFLAKIASDWQQARRPVRDQAAPGRAFLPALPVGRLPGVGQQDRGALAALGIATIADLRRLGAAELRERWGKFGDRLWDLAHGRDDSPVEPHRPVRQVSSETTFAEDLTREAVAAVLAKLAREVWAAVAKSGRARPHRDGQAADAGFPHGDAPAHVRGVPRE